MRRVVLDIGVVVSGLISDEGPPARILDHWRHGRFEIVLSDAWLEEFDDVFARPHLASRIGVGLSALLRAAIIDHGVVVRDQQLRPGATPDPDDDYLVALADACRCDYLVSGDRHLLGIVAAKPPVLTPRQFLDVLERAP